MPMSLEVREKRRLAASAWNKAHPDRVRENAKNYQRRNKAKCLAWSNAWRKRNPLRSKEIMDAYIERNPWYYSYQAAKARCLNAFNPRYEHYGAGGIEFKMTMKEFGELWVRDNAAAMTCPSIDRINNDGHYEISNCRFIEKSENSARRVGKKHRKHGLFEVKQPYLRPFAHPTTKNST